MKIVTLDPREIVVGDRFRKKENPRYESIRDSIKDKGVLNPILVQKVDGAYHLRAGETRLRACIELKEHIPCHVANEDLPSDALEFIENFARADLEWQDEVNAINSIHNILVNTRVDWTQKDTSTYLSVDQAHVSRCIRVSEEMSGKPELSRHNSVRAAYTEVVQHEQAKLAAIITDIVCDDFIAAKSTEVSAETTDSGAEDTIADIASIIDIKEEESRVISCMDFHSWNATYIGPKFNVVHCDFPYGRMAVDGAGPRWAKYSDTPDIYFNLLDTLLTSPHIEQDAVVCCWLDMKHFCSTQALAKHCGWTPTVYPFILHKTNRSGHMPGKYQGRRTYEVMHFFYRGEPVILTKPKLLASCDVDDNIMLGHAEKPVDFLKQALSMFVGPHTRFLDPTCGSATSLIAARALGAKYIVGVELRSEMATWANARYLSTEK